MTARLPPLPPPDALADLCREAAAQQRVPAAALEKDLYLTRLLWALGERFGPDLLLKGGTCLMKVDIGFRRMSEDIDIVLPWDRPTTHKGTNALRTNRVRDALRELGPVVGFELETFDGYAWDKRSHVKWTVHYPSRFGRVFPGRAGPTSTIDVEAALRPVVLPPRAVPLRQALADPVIGDYAPATCWALDFAEVRAEKVRAAITRDPPAIRDYYDLGLILDAGADMSSDAFVALVDQKLAEVGAAPLAQQPPSFGMSGARRRDLEAGRATGLRAVVRLDEPPFDLDRVLAEYDALWATLRRRSEAAD